MNTTTKTERGRYVAQMRVNSGIEGKRPDTDDLTMQQSYIDGTASLDDLLQYARDCATCKGVLDNIKNRPNGS